MFLNHLQAVYVDNCVPTIVGVLQNGMIVNINNKQLVSFDMDEYKIITVIFEDVARTFCLKFADCFGICLLMFCFYL